MGRFIIRTQGGSVHYVHTKFEAESLNIHYVRRLRFSSDADIVRLTNARIIIIIIIMQISLLIPPTARPKAVA